MKEDPTIYAPRAKSRRNDFFKRAEGQPIYGCGQSLRIETLGIGTLRIKTGRVSVLDIWLTMMRLRARGKTIRLVVIDDLQRLHPRWYRRKLADLRALAKEIQIPVVVLSRLSQRALAAIIAP